MGGLLGNRMVVLGMSLFAALYLLAGSMMAVVGIVAVHLIPHLFKTGSVIWVGVLVFVIGVVLLLLSVCTQHVSIIQSYIMFLLCLLVLIFTIVNIVLMEIVEWDYLEVKKAADASDDDLRKSENSLIFLSYLLGLLGSVIGLVASFFGTIYVYFTLTLPLLKAEKQSKPQYRVEIRKQSYIKHKKQPLRKFNFKLTPPPEVQHTAPSTTWSSGESDLYHVSWVYEDQAAGQQKDKADNNNDEPNDNRALMDEIKARVSSRRPPSPTSFDVTAQMNLYPILDETSSNQSEPVRGRIGQLLPNTRSSFQRKSVDPLTEECTKL
ncbi:uncharacterized protein LOC117303353 [Asterias rubens]|uniref:uncharacterized protein LOC117303353 n=1 Tax=Asterias rubens TaxID=7604 RepID=UPI00145559E8|nr:uncharacterized protein LOC117303353 [Asterias rubens]XP_033643414.1 uncharacterized protein LOC117303353 [Asterias rubens]